ncbi:MAG: DUF2793 domain-containing protein [Ruegeria sp.]
MSQTTPKLNLPFLQPSQAQKHITHNEALRQLDLVVQLSAVALDQTIPPAAPSQGAIYGLGANSTGDWAGQSGNLAAWLDNAWYFVAPVEGWRVWDQAASALRIWDGDAWIDPPITTANLDGVGIATGFDATNRLSVRGPATLLSHDGGGHQLKINKASMPDTASLLFQSNWTGHAEMGLAGGTDFVVKVSPDGGSWSDALRVDALTGTISGAAVQAAAADVTPGRLMRADFGYGPGNLLGTVNQSNGVPTGAVIERGATAEGEFVRFADGTQICTTGLSSVACTTIAGAMFASPQYTWDFPAAFAQGSVPSLSGSGGAVGRFLSLGAASETQASWQVLSAVSDNNLVAPTITAIGRWV